MTLLASNKTGEIGVADREIQAFQPFFQEHDPPKVLAIGDLIDLRLWSATTFHKRSNSAWR